MDRRIGLVASALVLLWCSVVRGTSDSGTGATLLAVGGPRQRYAIIAEDLWQEGCPGRGCELYVLDLRSRKPRRLHRKPVTTAAEGLSLVDTYVASLPSTTRKTLLPLSGTESLTTLPVDTQRSTATAVHFALPHGDTLVAELHTLDRFASMTPYLHGSDTELCFDTQTWKPICSSCKAITRSVDGKSESTWTCQGPGTYTRDGQRHPCDCSGVGERRTIRLTRSGDGTRSFGNEFLVEPHRLNQNTLGGTIDIDLDLATGESVGGPDFRPSITAFETDAAILVVGNATHARLANGTHFPIVAAIGKSRRATWP